MAGRTGGMNYLYVPILFTSIIDVRCCTSEGPRPLPGAEMSFEDGKGSNGQMYSVPTGRLLVPGEETLKALPGSGDRLDPDEAPDASTRVRHPLPRAARQRRQNSRWPPGLGSAAP